MLSRLLPALSVAALLCAPTATLAASITVSTFSPTAFTTLLSTGTFVGEDFETLGTTRGEGEVAGPLSTAVGTFVTAGGVGSGGTVTGLPGNTGRHLALRDGNVFGRNNAVPVGGGWFLDSNDTAGMIWNVSVGGLFDTVAFVLSDASDVGAYLRITAGNLVHEMRTGGALPDGSDRLVVVSFGQAVASAQIALVNYTAFGGGTLARNDGFSVDGAQVRLSAVPVPAAGLLMIAGLGALAAVRARRRA
jgi:hypothetical protein